MDRAEATGVGVSLAGHGTLLAALSLGFAAATRPPLMNDPLDAELVDEVRTGSLVCLEGVGLAA